MDNYDKNSLIISSIIYFISFFSFFSPFVYVRSGPLFFSISLCNYSLFDFGVSTEKQIYRLNKLNNFGHIKKVEERVICVEQPK